MSIFVENVRFALNLSGSSQMNIFIQLSSSMAIQLPWSEEPGAITDLTARISAGIVGPLFFYSKPRFHNQFFDNTPVGCDSSGR
jgi:hypothetical protein